MDHLKEINTVWPMIIAIGSLVAFGAWIKLEILGLKKTFEILKKQVDDHIENDHQVQLVMATNIAEIKTMLKTRPCISHHEQQCELDK